LFPKYRFYHFLCRTFVFQAIILGTTFLKLPESTSAYYSRGGILFLYALMCSLPISNIDYPCFLAPYSCVSKCRNLKVRFCTLIRLTQLPCVFFFLSVSSPCMLLTYSVRSFAMSEIPALFSQRPIVERHKKAAMYHPFVEGLAITLVDVPVTFATMVLYTIILYFLVKLQQTAGQFLLSSRLILSVTFLITLRCL
jgi:hypothetical protein